MDDIDPKGRFVNLFDKFSPLCGMAFTTNFAGKLYCYSVALAVEEKQSNFLAVEYFHSIYIS